MVQRSSLSALALGVAGLAAPASAQDVPTIDTEDATLGSAKTGGHGSVHPSLAIDLRNGDYARGSYDDDRADLSRLPVHAQVGFAFDLADDREGNSSSWLVLRSSNGFHAPIAEERTAPRSWYESNNLAALVFTPAKGLRVAAVYTIKTSPNGISGTTHEASLSFAYKRRQGFGALMPTLSATVRPKGDSGVYTQAGVAPHLALARGDDAPAVELPLTLGMGWSGFYGAGSGNRLYGRAGAALVRPFAVGATRWRARAEAVALIRDDRLARLSGPDGETGTVIPLFTLSLSAAY